MNRITFPESFFATNARIISNNIPDNWDKSNLPPWKLRIYGELSKTPKEIQEIVDHSILKIRDLNLERGSHSVNYGIYWNPEEFLEEKKLKGLFFEEVEVSSCAHEADSSKHPFEGGSEPYQQHSMH